MNNKSPQTRERRRIRKSNESGQALVELLLVSVMIYIPLLIGAVEFARIAYAYIEVSNAARAAVQYGAKNTGTAADTVGQLTAAQNDYSLAPAAINLTSSSVVCSCSDDGSTIACQGGTCSGSTAQIEKTLTVQLQSTFDPGFYEPFLARSFTINGIAVQKVLQ